MAEFDCSVKLKKFQPETLTSLYTLNSQSGFLRSVDQSREVADELWDSILDSVSSPKKAEARAQLCLNFENPVVVRLSTLQDRALQAEAIKMLYVQSLLLGHYPLRSQETSVLSEGLINLIYYSAQDPRSQVEALENLVRLADSVQDVHGGYNARMEMIQCATFAGLKDKALVAFTWCLAQSDKSPDVFDAHTLLWKFKWVLENIPNFLQVPKKKIYELQDDMQQRLLAAGYNLRPVQFLRWTNAMRMGEFDRAAVYMEKWEQTSRDEMADCLACEQNKLSEYFGRIGKLKQSDETAAKLLDGRMTCAEIPHLTYGHLVPTYLKLGRSDELKKKHRAWYKLIKDNEEFLAPVSYHLLLVGGAGKYPAAIAMFERHAPWAIKTVNDTHRFGPVGTEHSHARAE